jgi:hypothetical protein
MSKLCRLSGKQKKNFRISIQVPLLENQKVYKGTTMDPFSAIHTMQRCELAMLTQGLYYIDGQNT